MSVGNFDRTSFDIRIGGFDGDSGADTHDGAEPWRQRTYRDDSKPDTSKREARERLREQIRAAIEGEPILLPALERIAEPGPEPLEERVDLGELTAQAALWNAVFDAARRAADEDDNEVMMLL